MKLLFDREEKDIRCVLLGVGLPLGEDGRYLENYFKEQYDINVKYIVETKTVPGEGKEHSRIDQIFTVLEDSVEKFAAIKNELGAEYAKDIVRKGKHRLYKEKIYLSYFQRFENELLKSGEITADQKYQSKILKKN